MTDFRELNQNTNVPKSILRCSLLLFLSSTPAHSDNTIDELKSYFDSNPACSVAEISNLSRKNKSITISLEIKPPTEHAISRMTVKSRNAWMALHCPPFNHELWNKPGIRDFLVETQTANDESRSVSCKAYFDSLFQRQHSINTSVAERIRKLLGKD